jgi:hypothetical protein
MAPLYRTKDMTIGEFSRAVKRHGFKLEPMGPLGAGWRHPDFPNMTLGSVYSLKGKLLRSATLAKILRDKDRLEAERDAAAKKAATGMCRDHQCDMGELEHLTCGSITCPNSGHYGKEEAPE